MTYVKFDENINLILRENRMSDCVKYFIRHFISLQKPFPKYGHYYGFSFYKAIKYDENILSLNYSAASVTVFIWARWKFLFYRDKSVHISLE